MDLYSCNWWLHCQGMYKGVSKRFQISSLAHQQMVAQGCTCSYSDLQSWWGSVPRDIAVLTPGVVILVFLCSWGVAVWFVYCSGEVQDLDSGIWESKVDLGSDSKFPFWFPVGDSLAGKNQAVGITYCEESGDCNSYLNCIIFLSFFFWVIVFRLTWK
jgi:hypothetical protein